MGHSWTYGTFLGRLDTIDFTSHLGATPPDTETLSLAYLNNDDLHELTHGNGEVTDFEYFTHGPLKALRTDELDLDYLVDAALNVDDLTETRGSGGPTAAIDYGYDNLNRLGSAGYPSPSTFGLPDGTESFGYDDAGNRNDTGWSRDGGNRITASGAPASGEYAHDADGNLCKTSASAINRTVDPCDGANVVAGEVLYGFDYTNRLRTVSSPGTTTVAHSYAYDPFGRRIRKVTGGATTWYLWDGDRLLAEFDGDGDLERRYAYAGGFAPAQVADVGVGSEAVYDVHTDHLQTPRLLTDPTGAAVWRASYEAYGEAHLDGGNSVDFHIRFPGQYRDQEAEDWDPNLGGAG